MGSGFNGAAKNVIYYGDIMDVEGIASPLNAAQ